MKIPFETFQPIVRCPVCNKKYRPAKMLLVSEDEKRTTLHLTCEHCDMSTLVFVSLSQFGAVSLGFPTDLVESEVRQMLNREAITADHVIAVHEFLKTSAGDVDALIGNLK